jgi:very-short-patch-repair endonuclease
VKKRKIKHKRREFVYLRVIGEKRYNYDEFTCKNSDPAHRFAKRRLKNPTAAESEFERIINSLYDGYFVGKFEREWAICGKWILDFYFPRYRFAVEIDGSFHNSARQKQKDQEKAAACQKLEITLLRFSNQEIFGDRKNLLEKFIRGLLLAAEKAKECTKIQNTPPAGVVNKTVLTKRESFLIKRFLEFYKSLATGERTPSTAKQKHFVEVCKGKTKPETEHEIAFVKFIKMHLKKR